MTSIDELAIDGISDRRTAEAMHKNLKAMSSSPLTMGKLYLVLLERQLWRNQAAMARGLGVSTAQVSRCLAIARLPPELLTTVGDKNRITYRTGQSLDTLVDSIGLETVRRWAKRGPAGKAFPASTILNALATGRKPTEKPPMVRLSMSPNEGYIRLDSPQIERLLPILGELERIVQDFISAALA